jgi:hypothetical protein
MKWVVNVMLTLTNSMQLSISRVAATFAATQGPPKMLLNPNVHYRIHNSPPPVTMLNQINPDHTIPYHPIHQPMSSRIPHYTYIS